MWVHYEEGAGVSIRCGFLLSPPGGLLSIVRGIEQLEYDLPRVHGAGLVPGSVLRYVHPRVIYREEFLAEVELA